MPQNQPKRASKQRRTGYAVALALAGVVAAFGLFALVANVLTKPSSGGHVGGRSRAVYDLGGSKLFATQIAENGPLLLPALVGGNDLMVQHLGADPAKGWYAFDARASDQPRRCDVQWKAAQQQFVDPCRGQSYPADGTGLTHHPVTVAANGRVSVDLRTNLP